LPILKTIPFDKLDISVLGVEVSHLGKVFDGDREELDRLLEAAGFHHHSNVGEDAFFVKEKKKKKKKKKHS